MNLQRYSMLVQSSQCSESSSRMRRHALRVRTRSASSCLCSEEKESPCARLARSWARSARLDGP